jgi:Holliday junction resolvase
MSLVYNKRYENEYVKMQISKGWHCERVAGSGSGADAVCDCVLFREGKVYLVEVKATKAPKFYFRGYIKEQLDRMKTVAKQSNVGALLAIKYKYRGWEEVDLDADQRQDS